MVKSLKLTIINDNEPGKGLVNEWGWSVLVESEKWSFLFDADTSPSVIEHNCKALGIDLSSIDFAVLSHWHSDHYGGFEYVGQVHKNLKVYVPPGSLSIFKNWGLKAIVVSAPQEIAKDVWSTGPIGYISEQAVGINVDNLGYVVIVGCSHPGVDVLTKKIVDITGGKIHLTIGGYHNPSKKALDKLALITDIICPAHCSGESAKEYVKKKYPSKYFSVRTGSVVKLP